MAARVVSAVSIDFFHSLVSGLLSRPAVVRSSLRQFSLISRYRTPSVYLSALQCISSVHSSVCCQTPRLKLWDEYSRVKSYVEGNTSLNRTSTAVVTHTHTHLALTLLFWPL